MTYQPFNIAKTVFGESIVTNDTPTIQIANQYGLDPALRDDLETFTGTGGSADSNGNLFRCQSGVSVGGYGVIRSLATARYRPGQGIIARFTAAFTTGVASSLQFGGLFSLTETLAFGYDGADFSIIHEYDGKAEVQEIQVTATPSGTENATVTLDGSAVVISITNSTVQTNAEELRAGLAADGTVGAAWRFEQIDDTVVCISQSVGNKTGTMSFSSSTATANVTEAQAGAAKSSGNVAQASWDTAPFAGFDPTNLNVYEVSYGYLGAVGPRFSIYNPTIGVFDVLHQIQWANANTTPLFGNPDMKIGWTAASLGSSGSNLTVTGASCYSAIQGNEVIQNTSRAADHTKSSVGTTLTNILSIQNRITYGDQFNLGIIEPVSISFDLDHNKGAVVEIYKNATLGGTPNYQLIDEVNSVAAVDTAGTTVTGGTLIEAFTVPAGGDATIELLDLRILLEPEEIITVAAHTVSGTATTMTTAVTWLEEK